MSITVTGSVSSPALATSSRSPSALMAYGLPRFVRSQPPTRVSIGTRDAPTTKRDAEPSTSTRNQFFVPRDVKELPSIRPPLRLTSA
ncbi:MAG: hypothetical protein ACRD2N_24210, partial [Vicinamibacterales bacterium]